MNLTWKQLEQICVYRMAGEQKRGSGEMARASVTGSQLIGRPELNKDRVDFEGYAGHDWTPFKMECKSCSTASFELREVMFKRGQYDELVAFDGVAFLLIHFNPRHLVRTVTEAKTFAFPVYKDHEFWSQYETGEAKSINHEDCSRHAIAVKWNTLPGCKKLSPDIVTAVKFLKAARKLADEVKVAM